MDKRGQFDRTIPWSKQHPIPNCRLCHHYTPQGRRGGTCQLLNAPVHSHWQACSLGQPLFETPWNKLQEIQTLLPNIVA